LDGIAEILRFIREIWYKKVVLLIILILIPCILLISFCGFDFSKLIKSQLIFLSIYEILMFLTWLITNRIPKANKKKIGIVIAIKTKTKEQHDAIKWKLVDTFTKYIQDNSDIPFQVIHLQQHYINKFDINKDNEDSIKKLVKKTNAMYCIFGRCYDGNINNLENYVIDINAAVSHKPLPPEIQNEFSDEFSEVFINKKLIPKSDDITNFNLFSEQLEVVSKYILSEALSFSGFIYQSKELFEKLNNQLVTYRKNIEPINTIKSRLPAKLFDIYLFLARNSYIRYRKSHNTENLLKLKEYMNLLNDKIPDTYDYLILSSIYYFLDNRQIKYSKAQIEKCKTFKDAAWRYNDAFLYAYEGYLKTAYRKYMTAFKYNFEYDRLFDVEEFIYEIYTQEPDKYQLLFILGLINYHLKDDKVLSTEYFDKFIEYPNNKYNELIDIAIEYIKNKIKSIPADQTTLAS